MARRKSSPDGFPYWWRRYIYARRAASSVTNPAQRGALFEVLAIVDQITDGKDAPSQAAYNVEEMSAIERALEEFGILRQAHAINAHRAAERAVAAERAPLAVAHGQKFLGKGRGESPLKALVRDVMRGLGERGENPRDVSANRVWEACSSLSERKRRGIIFYPGHCWVPNHGEPTRARFDNIVSEVRKEFPAS